MTPQMMKILPTITEEAGRKRKKKGPNLGKRAAVQREQQDALVPELSIGAKQTQQRWLNKTGWITRKGHTQRDNILDLIKYMQHPSDPGVANTIKHMVIATDKAYLKQITKRRFKTMFNPGERKKLLKERLFTDSGKSRAEKTVEVLSTILEEYAEAEKYLESAKAEEVVATQVPGGLRPNPKDRAWKPKATGAINDYFLKTVKAFDAVSGYVKRNPKKIKGMWKSHGGRRKYAKIVQNILKDHQVDPVGLFQRFGRAKYLGFGQGRAHSKPEKIFGMLYKAKEWKVVGSIYQDILKYISESPDDVPTQEPAYYDEESPMSFTFMRTFQIAFELSFHNFLEHLYA